MLRSKHESWLDAVVDTAVDGVILFDAKGCVLMFNPACEKLFGYAADEVIGKNVKLLMPTSYRDEHDAYIANFDGTADREVNGIGRKAVGRRKDGSAFPMGLSVGTSKQNGQSIFVGMIHDLTERERAEQALRESAAKLTAVVDTAVDGVILIDGQGCVLMFNPACERLFGYAAGEVIGENVRLLMPSPHRDEDDRENFLGIGERKSLGIRRDVEGRRKDGSTFPMDISVGEAKQAGGSSFVGIVHDLTERKRTEEQLVQAQKMETVGQLSGGIAHDFNNLLTVIVGNAEVLSRQLKARPDLQRLAEDIEHAGDRGAELTQRLLAFSRRQTLSPMEFDCNDHLEFMRALLRRMLREDIDIKTAFDADLRSTFADPAQLESAVLNLALNAQDAMPGGGCLTLTTANLPLDGEYASLHPEVRPGEYVMIAITDNGEGMPKEVLDHVFEPFFTTKEVGKGSGLGLSMVYGFAKQSNGHVAIYSEPSLGTTVRIYLPATASKAGKPRIETPTKDEALPIRLQVRQETVLVVEDDPFVRTYAVNCLASLGYRVVEALDGGDALKKLSDGVNADILFTDVVMPGGISGWELAERARQAWPALRVLLTSGYALETLAANGRLPSGLAILNKPYRKADLAHRLHEVRNGSRPQQ
jgi:PAS domain S-box-containing protein